MALSVFAPERFGTLRGGMTQSERSENRLAGILGVTPLHRPTSSNSRPHEPGLFQKKSTLLSQTRQESPAPPLLKHAPRSRLLERRADDSPLIRAPLIRASRFSEWT